MLHYYIDSKRQIAAAAAANKPLPTPPVKVDIGGDTPKPAEGAGLPEEEPSDPNFTIGDAGESFTEIHVSS